MIALMVFSALLSLAMIALIVGLVYKTFANGVSWTDILIIPGVLIGAGLALIFFIVAQGAFLLWALRFIQQ